MQKINYIFLVLLFTVLFSQAQDQPESTVWQNFYTIVALPPAAQSKAFVQLEQYCIKNNIVKDSTYTNLLFLYAAAEYTQQRSSRAIALLEKSIHIASVNIHKNPAQYLGKYYFYLGHYLQESGNAEKALEQYKMSLAFSKTAVDKWGIRALACQAIAHSYYEITDFYRGIQYAQLGYQYAAAKTDTGAMGRSLYEKAINLNGLGDIKGASMTVNLLRQLKTLNLNAFELGNYHKLYGDLALIEKNFIQCRNWYLKAADSYQKVGQFEEMGGIYIDMHYVAVRSGDKASARRYEKLALQSVKNPYYLCRLFDNLALYYISQQDTGKAFSSFRKGFEALPMDFKPQDSLQNPTAAQIRLLPEKDYPFSLLMDKADLFMQCGNFQQALKTFELLVAVSDDMRREHLGVYTKLYWRGKLKKMYEQAVESCYQLNNTDKAFYFLEKSRAALFNDDLNELKAETTLPAALVNKESSLKKRLKNLQNERPQRISLLIDAQEDLARFIKSIEQHYPGYFEMKYNNDVPGTQDLQNYLQKNHQSFLSFFVGQKQVYRLLISPGYQSLTKINPIRYNENVKDFLELSINKTEQNQHFERFLKLSNALYLLLIEPIAHRLLGRVIVSAEDLTIPFAALSKTDKKPAFLVNSYAFSYSYSARMLLKPRVKVKNEQIAGDYIGFAPVNYRNSFNISSLPGSWAAIKKNASWFRSSRLFTGTEATKQGYLDYWSKYTIVELVTHANGDSLNPEPFLYFADSILKSSEVRDNMVGNSKLVVLSACRTGTGKLQSGEGIYSLSREYLCAGVPGVLSTIWEVEDQDAYSLTDLFLERVKDGQPLDIALQNAQKIWLSEKNNIRKLPFSWSGIILTGDSKKIEFLNKQGGQFMNYYLAVLVVCMVIIVFIYSFRRI